MGQSGSKCSITPLFCYIFIGKSVYCDCAWHGEYLGRIYQKWKILTLVHVFAHNSKSILTQSASFSYAGTHISIPGHRTMYKLFFFFMVMDSWTIWHIFEKIGSTCFFRPCIYKYNFQPFDLQGPITWEPKGAIKKEVSFYNPDFFPTATQSTASQQLAAPKIESWWAVAFSKKPYVG